MDVVDAATRSRMMKGIRSKDTQPEMIVRKYLHSHGFRYRLHTRNLPGSPDLVLPKYRVAIFVHGCFWHRHAGCKFATTPANNAECWQLKFDGNVERDARKESLLRGAGWKVIVVWECELRRAPEEKLRQLVRDFAGSDGSGSSLPISAVISPELRSESSASSLSTVESRALSDCCSSVVGKSQSIIED